MPAAGDLRDEVLRRTAVTADSLRRMGIQVPDALPPQVRRIDDWLLDAEQVTRWGQQLRDAVENHTQRDALSAGLSKGAAVDLLALPDSTLLTPLILEAGLHQAAGRITTGSGRRTLGPAEKSTALLERELNEYPFRAPEAQRLSELGLGERELAAAERHGRLLRLADGVVLLPSSPARAMRELAALEQPFTMSAARQALGTTRRVAVPLLEHLDSLGWTRRLDASLREVVR